MVSSRSALDRIEYSSSFCLSVITAKGPGLGVHGAGRLGRQSDEFFDETVVDAAILVAADGTTGFKHLYQIHIGSFLSLRCGGYVFHYNRD